MHEPMGSWMLSCRLLKFGRNSQSVPSRETKSLHLNRLGMGKQSVMKRISGEVDDTAILAADSWRCSRTTSFDQSADLLHGSFPMIKSRRASTKGFGSGREGHFGTSNSSSSSIHSGKRSSHLRLGLTGSSPTITISDFGTSCCQVLISVLLKFNNPTLEFFFRSHDELITLEMVSQLTSSLDT